jgi:predicted nucleic acid-binding protein
MVVLDSSFLLLVIYDRVAVPKDPATGKPYEKGRERVEYLIDTLSDAKIPILIPTPVLAEVLVRAGAATAQLLARFKQIPLLKVGNFDERAAVELAQMTGAALKASRKKAPSDAPYQKVKLDRQIIAIAKVERATTIYTDDGDLAKLATAERIQAIGLGSLRMPPLKEQPDLPLEGGGKETKK